MAPSGCHLPQLRAQTSYLRVSGHKRDDEAGEILQRMKLKVCQPLQKAVSRIVMNTTEEATPSIASLTGASIHRSVTVLVHKIYGDMLSHPMLAIDGKDCNIAMLLYSKTLGRQYSLPTFSLRLSLVAGLFYNTTTTLLKLLQIKNLLETVPIQKEYKKKLGSGKRNGLNLELKVIKLG